VSNVIIFGNSDLADLAYFYFKHDSDHDVVAFTINEKFISKENTYNNLPLLPFETIEEHFDPDQYVMFAPLTGRGMNRNRERIFNQAKEKGFSFISYISSKATIWPDSKIGDNCFIFEDNTIQPFTSIGDNVIMWSGNHIGHHGVIKDHVFFTSHVVLSGHCVVESYSFFGVNSTIRDGLHISEGTLVAMGANLSKDTEAWGVYFGNPARKGPKPSHEVY
jgi:sugar O-acyltransferase (sialic acid O-acetyltransferase NeuD family)